MKNSMRTLQILRRAGFFKDFVHLSDEALLNLIHDRRKKADFELFGYEFKTERNLSDRKLATQDTKKMLYLDLEADVCRENKVYTWLLQALDEISGQPGLITDIQEDWSSEQGPILIRCKINDVAKEYRPVYHDDWVDEHTLENMLADIAGIVKEEFHNCLGPNYEWFGQDVNYIRLKSEERKILKEELGWKFFDEFLVEMNS